MSDHRLAGRLTLVSDVPECDELAALFLRHLLKRLGRDRQWKCKRGELVRDDGRVHDLEMLTAEGDKTHEQ
jgi:hypothetical protein